MPPSSITRGLLAALLLAAPLAARPISDAPLGVGTPGPIRALFLDMPLADAGRADRPAVDVRWVAGNSWSEASVLSRGDQRVVVQTDGQTDALQATVSAPWSRWVAAPWAQDLATAVEVRTLLHWGGWSDRPIEAWHHFAAYYNFDRELFPRNRLNYTIRDVYGRTLADRRSATLGLGDVAVRTQWTALQGGVVAGGARYALAVRLDLKLPTGSLGAFTGSGAPDAGLGVAVTYRPAGWLTLHGLLSARAVGDFPHAFPLQPRRLQLGADLGIVVRIADRVALVVEDRVSSPLVEAGWTQARKSVTDPEAGAWYGIARTYNQISGGVRVGDVTFHFSEDFTPIPRLRYDPGPSWFYDSNQPDFLIGLTWSRAL